MMENLEELLYDSPMCEYAGFVREDLIEFGQMVAKECAKIADSTDKNPAGCGWVTKTKGELIKKHFGVEE